jgi:predicted membrane protein
LSIPLTLIRQSLIDAINKQDLHTVILILAHRKLSNEDINTSLLHLAASQGNITILQLLLWVKSLFSSSSRK